MVFQLPWKSSKDSAKPAEKPVHVPKSASDSLFPCHDTEQDVVEKSTRWSDPTAFPCSPENIIPHAELLATPYTAVAFIAGIATGTCGVFMWNRWLRRIRTADWVTPDILTRRRWVKGIVTSVGDADNFRLYHTPGIGWGWFRTVPTSVKDLKDQTIHVRIAGVDAPEGGHFGRPSQPHAEESLLWLKNRLEGRLVYCQLIRKDQYGRVSSPFSM
ncbi:hypothetical protein EDD17DRAFT_1591379 [Pisolithus thermaeus]|nr:hypothetical protein EDD17DRAFT_1591379 [Pisolithus thermaeus]